MTSAIIYYGAPTKASQTVSEEVRSRGLNLLRSNPSSALPEVYRENNHLQYLNYVNNFAASVKAAYEDKYVYLNDASRFYFLPTTTLPPFHRTPSIVWNFSRGVAPETLSMIRDRYNAVETVAQGKPAFAAHLSYDQLKTLVTEYSPSDKTPASTTTMNIAGARGYKFLHQLADLFLRIHQYPLVSDPSKGKTSYFKEALQVQMKDVELQTKEYSAGKPDAYKVFAMSDSSRVRLNMNLIEKDLSKVNYRVITASDMTSEHSILFPYVECLSKPDSTMVISTIDRYFIGLLGDDINEAREMFSFLKSVWGTLENTMWGQELSHIYSGIRLSLESGAMMRVVTTPNSIYTGFILIGAGYKLKQYGIEYAPMPQNAFTQAFLSASPHLSSLTNIIGWMQYSDDMERSQALIDINSMQKLGTEIRRVGFNITRLENIKLAARNLTFPSDQFLPMTSVNVARVLTAIVNNASEELFPLHHVALLEPDRMKRLLSAFGAVAPSFLIPGGRTMSLEGAFEFNMKVSGKKEARSTVRVFAMGVPWEKACVDMARVIAERCVASPIGTPLVGRASSFSVIREYDGAGGASVLAALKNLAGVVMNTNVEGGSSGGKRGRDDEPPVPPVGKKARFDF